MTDLQKQELKAESQRQQNLRDEGVPEHVFPTKHGKKCNSWQARMRRGQGRLAMKARKLGRTLERR